MGKPQDDAAWDEAQRRCRLSDQEVRMAKELGFKPKSLIKNIPAPSQKWKAPVSEWVRALHEKKIGSRQPAGGVPATRTDRVPARQAVGHTMQERRGKVIEFRNPEHPWPDNPEIPELVLDDPFDSEFAENGDAGWGYDTFESRYAPPQKADIEEQNIRMLRSQCLFRWAAQTVAVAMSQLPEVQKVAAFGAVARPLRMEVPRFPQFRRHRIAVLHECSDLDLAVWTNDPSRLKVLKSALSRGLSLVQDTPYGGVAHHQVDVHILDAGSGAYRGRLCIFGQCPKPGKRECLVPHCGTHPFLRQFERYRFNPEQFEGEPAVILFDRASGFLVRPPRIDAKPTRFVHRANDEMRPAVRGTEADLEAGSDDDVPF